MTLPLKYANIIARNTLYTTYTTKKGRVIMKASQPGIDEKNHEKHAGKKSPDSRRPTLRIVREHVPTINEKIAGLIAKIQSDDPEWIDIVDKICSDRTFLLSQDVINAFLFSDKKKRDRPSSLLRDTIAEKAFSAFKEYIAETVNKSYWEKHVLPTFGYFLITLAAQYPNSLSSTMEFLTEQCCKANVLLPQRMSDRIDKLLERQDERSKSYSNAQGTPISTSEPVAQKPHKKKHRKARMSKKEFAEKYPNGKKHKHQSKKGLGKNR